MNAKYTVEEVLEMAAARRFHGDYIADALTDYANLLAEIERAKAWVTDEVSYQITRAIKPFEEVRHSDVVRVRAALESVAHLLPRGEVKADEGAVPVAFRFLGPDGEAVTEWEDAPITDKKFPDLCPSIESVQYAYPRPPAQAAQVDDAASLTVREVVERLVNERDEALAKLARIHHG